MLLCCSIQNTTALQQDPPYFEDTIQLVNDSTLRVQADSSGIYYDIIGDSALAALVRAADIGDFEIYIDDSYYDSWGLFISEIAGRTNAGYDGWQFWVNYPTDDIPMVAADTFVLENGDTLDWFFGGYGFDPESSDMKLLLHIEVVDDTTPPEVTKTTPSKGGFYLLGSKLTTLPLPMAIVFGGITLSTEYSEENTMHRVEFYIDNELLQVDYSAPFEHALTGLGTGSHTMKTIAYDSAQNTNIQETQVLFVSN